VSRSRIKFIGGLLCLLWLVPGLLKAATVGLIVQGLGGNPDYEKSFTESVDKIAAGFSSLSSNESDVMVLRGVDANRPAILQAIEEQGAKPADQFFLVLLGHGSYDKDLFRFNIGGPDVTTDDLVGALAGGSTNRQLIMISSSASGALLDVLRQPNRILVTATKSGGEINAVNFSEFFAQAVEGGRADTDRNEILTIAEAFRLANEKTQDHYRERKLLASEHARLRGDEAAQFSIARLGALAVSKGDAKVEALLEIRLDLETQFHTLKRNKSSMATETYYAELESLLLAIARLQQRIDDATGWSESDV